MKAVCIGFFLLTLQAFASLTKEGPGLWFLTDSSAVTDPIIINLGTLQVINNLGSPTGDIHIETATLRILNTLAPDFSTQRSVSIGADAIIDVDANTAEFAGGFTGLGNLTKTGNGTLILSSLGALSTTTVQQGEFQLTSAATLHSNTITVQPGATFSGEGTAGIAVVGSFLNQGTVIPGEPSLTILSSYQQATGSFLEIAFNPTQANLMNVTNTAQIQSGATILLSPEPGEYGSTNYPIFIATDGGTGTFDTVIFTLPAFSGSLLYLPSQASWTLIVLQMNLVPFSHLVTHGNAAAVARCLDSAFQPEGSDMRFITAALQFMTVPQMIQTMNQMNSSLYNALDLAQEQSMIGMRKTLSLRLVDIQRQTCASTKKAEGWGTVFYTRSTQDSQGENVGFQTRLRSVIGGIDFHLNQNTFLGTCFGYARECVTWMQVSSRSKIDSYAGGLYAGGRIQNTYMQGILMGFYDPFQGHRSIVFPTTLIEGFTRTARFSGSGEGCLASIEAGYMPQFESLIEVHPFITLDYVYAHRRSFQEQGAGSIDLSVESHNADLARSECGFKSLNCFSGVANSIWLPYLKLSWVFEKYFGADSRSSFVGSDCVMKVKGLAPTRNLIAWGLGIGIRGLKDRLFLGAEYEGEWAAHYHDYTFEAQLKLGF